MKGLLPIMLSVRCGCIVDTLPDHRGSYVSCNYCNHCNIFSSMAAHTVKWSTYLLSIGQAYPMRPSGGKQKY